MKSTIKLFLVIALFSSIALADDGNMSNGGRTCTQNCLVADQTIENSKDQETNNPVLDYVQDFLAKIFG